MAVSTDSAPRRSVLVGAVYVFVLGQILTATVAADLDGEVVLAVQVGLFALLGAAAVRKAPDRLRTLAVYVLTVAGLVGLSAGVRDLTGDLWAAMLALVGLTALFSYGLHRYELVMLDLVEEAT